MKRIRSHVGSGYSKLASNAKKNRAYREVEVSPLLLALAARTWSDVTGGVGVVLVDGKPVQPGKGGGKP